MNDLLEVSPHLHLFNKVHEEYFRRTALSCEEDLDCEELYTLLFQDIRQHQNVYLNGFFQLNDIYSERCAGILCALANIFRRKNQWKACCECLEYVENALQIYQLRACPPTAGAPHRRRRVQRSQLQCLANLTYKINDVSIEAYSHRNLSNAACRAFREACQYELSQKFELEQQKWLPVLFSIVGPSYEDLTKTSLQEISNASLWQALLHTRAESSPYDFDLKKCHGCNRMETARGEFEECSQCLKVSYCSLECQERNWKTHKRSCCGARRKRFCLNAASGLATSAKAFFHKELLECTLPRFE